MHTVQQWAVDLHHCTYTLPIPYPLSQYGHGPSCRGCAREDDHEKVLADLTAHEDKHLGGYRLAHLVVWLLCHCWHAQCTRQLWSECSSNIIRADVCVHTCVCKCCCWWAVFKFWEWSTSFNQQLLVLLHYAYIRTLSFEWLHLGTDYSTKYVLLVIDKCNTYVCTAFIHYSTRFLATQCQLMHNYVCGPTVQ